MTTPTRTQQLIERYQVLSEAADAPVLTSEGDAAIKAVDTFAKEQLRALNPALKWNWAGRTPSERQLKSDNLEWEFSVNSHSHGTGLPNEAKDWVESTLKPAVDKEYGEGNLDVTVDVTDAFFPKEDHPRGDLHLIRITLRLDNLRKSGLVS